MRCWRSVRYRRVTGSLEPICQSYEVRACDSPHVEEFEITALFREIYLIAVRERRRHEAV